MKTSSSTDSRDPLTTAGRWSGLAPLELLDRLAILLPLLRLHRHCHHGVLALDAGLRSRVTPEVPREPGLTAATGVRRRRIRTGS